MAKVTIDSKKLQATLNKLANKEKPKTTVVVGYTAKYALAVHEKVGMILKGQSRKSGSGKGKYWDPQGKAKAKFLEDPARTERKEIARVIQQAMQAGIPFDKALLLGGLRLQRESQKQVPVDLGNLKASAFTQKELL
jgi:ABC-type sulfate/molybdate transport systems ATPase subunit